jgi:hypothetical protein
MESGLRETWRALAATTHHMPRRALHELADRNRSSDNQPLGDAATVCGAPRPCPPRTSQIPPQMIRRPPGQRLRRERGPMVLITEAPRTPSFGTSCAKPQRSTTVGLAVVAYPRAAIGAERQTARDSPLLFRLGASGCNATVKFSLSSKAPSSYY